MDLKADGRSVKRNDALHRNPDYHARVSTMNAITAIGYEITATDGGGELGKICRTRDTLLVRDNEHPIA